MRVDLLGRELGQDGDGLVEVLGEGRVVDGGVVDALEDSAALS